MFLPDGVYSLASASAPGSVWPGSDRKCLANSSSSSMKETTINKLIILSLLGGRQCTKKEQKRTTYLASFEALDTKVSMVVASTVLWGTLFQFRIVRGRNNCS